MPPSVALPTGLRCVIVSVLALTGFQSAGAAENIRNGAYVFKVAGCSGCHTRDDDRKAGTLLAGGRAFKTPFGTYYSPNITPDKTGIGRWRKEDFRNALEHGVRPDGSNLFPVFPYVAYSRMSGTDITDLWGYLKSLPPIARKNRNHDVNAVFGSRFLVNVWKWLNFKSGVVPPDPGKSETWNRGRYLTDALGHCSECHTPRDALGGLQNAKYLSGTSNGPDGDAVPNITPDPATGIGKWSADDYDSLLSLGMLPDGDFVGSSMADVVRNTSALTASDRAAMIDYLKSVPPLSRKIDKKPAKK